MSNLVTPMLSSVEKSPTVEFYPSTICFSNSPCAIINNVTDQICINDTSEWNDLEQLMGRSNIFKTSTPIKSHNVTFNRRNYGNNSFVSSENAKIQESKQINEYLQNKEHTVQNVIEHSKIINNIWNALGSENNSCSKACVNVNMGYNEGSSLESMVCNKKIKSKQDFTISKNAVEVCNIKQVEATTIKAVDSNPSKPFIIPSPPNINNNYQTKSFKNGTKSGHSRQWGSCGSTAIFHINFDDTNIKTKLSPELKPMNTLNMPQNVEVCPMTSNTSTTEMRNKSFSQSNRLKRISQLSFEAEFDSDGRTHEQITIDFNKIDPYSIAGHITQMELTYFKAIKSEEFLSFKWTALSKHTHAPGIVASTRWFNQLNFWAQRIILECTELNRRSEMLIYLIRIIKKLVDSYNNLSSAMALMSALEVECIHRLKQTWNTLPNRDRATYRRMEELFSSTNNFEKLREHINSLKLPCIPYLGLYLTDLTYINIAHSKLSEFESQTKTDQINNILRTVSEFQQSEYDVSEIPNLFRYLESQRYIEELQKIIEENNYRTSISLEPNLDPSSQNTRQLQQQQQQQQQQLQQPDGSISPQKTPPSYACQHVAGLASLQSPISPKPMPNKAYNESINEVPEQQVIQSSVDDHDTEESVDNDHDVTKIQSTVNGDNVPVPGHQDGKDVLSYEESLIMSSRHSDDDIEDEAVRVTLLCGTSKKSQFKKRNSMATSHRFQRHSQSSSSSRRRCSSKTTTTSSNSQSGVSDKDILSQQSKSLLDDSYLDAMAADTGPLDGAGLSHGLAGLADTSAVASKHGEVMCTPPICKCIFKGDVIDLKPKATSKGKTEYSNLVNIAHAAEAAAQFSEKTNFYFPTSDSDPGDEMSAELSATIDDREPLKLVCQGVLSRMVCLKNSKKSRFSMWNRQWMVLLMSKNNAFLVFFENSQFRALDRKDFKSKKCHVQDMKRVVVSCHRPSLNKCISEQPMEDVCGEAGSGGSDGDHVGVAGDTKKFFLTDQEYGTVYKFRNPSKGKISPVAGNKRRSAGGGDHTLTRQQDDPTNSGTCLHTDLSSGHVMPTLAMWYLSIRRCLRALASPADEHKDLIMLGDT